MELLTSHLVFKALSLVVGKRQVGRVCAHAQLLPVDEFCLGGVCGERRTAGTKTSQGRPGSRGYEYQDARTYPSWGVDYLQYDWCHHGTQKAEASYRLMRDALDASGRLIVFSICEWGSNKPWLWAGGIGHLWRTTGDSQDCWDCRRDWGGLGVVHILDLQVGLESYAGPRRWNDPDMLEIGNGGLTLEENRAHFSLWAMLAAPLMAGNDLRSMTPEIRDVLTNRELIATGEVLIEAEKPGVVIGKNGATLREITKHIGWTPKVVRTPPIESSTVKQIRQYLRVTNEERKAFLRTIGRRIHRDIPGKDDNNKDATKKDQWIRVTTLGCCREVGRAAFLLSTPNSRVLIDCGEKPDNSGSTPYLYVPEIHPLAQLDAVVLTHAHLDQCALIPLLYKYGYEGPVYSTPPRWALVQAEKDFLVAEISVKEYLEGTFKKELQDAQAQITIAEENLRTSQNMLQQSQRMFREGYISTLELEGQQFSVQRSQLELDSARTAKNVLENFTKLKMIEDLQSKVETAKAKLESEKAAFALEESRLKRLEDQKGFCLISAPQDGMVVYANEQMGMRFGGQQGPQIEEGADNNGWINGR